MREPKNQMLGTMEPPLMQLSVNHGIHPFGHLLIKDLVLMFPLLFTSLRRAVKD